MNIMRKYVLSAIEIEDDEIEIEDDDSEIDDYSEYDNYNTSDSFIDDEEVKEIYTEYHENDNIQSDENEEDSSDENNTDLSDDDERKRKTKTNFSHQTDYNFGDKENIICNPLLSFYIKIPKENTIDKFSKSSQKMFNDLSKKFNFIIETFNSRDDINLNYLYELLKIIHNTYIDAEFLKLKKKFKLYFLNKASTTVKLKFNEKNVASKKVEKKDQKKVYELILKDQPKTVQIIISAIDISNSYIDYVLSTWKNPSDYYSEKNAIQRISENSQTGDEELKFEDIIDILNDNDANNIDKVLKEFKSRGNEIKSIFKLVKDIANLLAFKILNEQGNPLGGDKEWLSLNEDNFEKTLNVLKENEELKLALEEKNENCSPKIMNGLVDYAVKLNLDIKDLSYLLKGTSLRNYIYVEEDYSMENPKTTPKNFTFIDQFKQLSLYDLDETDGYNYNDRYEPVNYVDNDKENNEFKFKENDNIEDNNRFEFEGNKKIGNNTGNVYMEDSNDLKDSEAHLPYEIDTDSNSKNRKLRLSLKEEIDKISMSVNSISKTAATQISALK
ncbi:28645_t:CDS:2, partial [Dentiscutata erythropus]